MNKLLLAAAPLSFMLFLSGCGNSKTDNVKGATLPRTPATYHPIPLEQRLAARKAKDLPYAQAIAYNAGKK